MQESFVCDTVVTMDNNGKIEIAYFTFDRDGRRSTSCKRKVVKASRLKQELSKLEEKGHEIYGTRDAQ